MAAILNFQQKHKIAYISLTMRDRAILSKFSTLRVSHQDTLLIFQNCFVFRKMAAILNFRIFGKIAYISLAVRDKAILPKFQHFVFATKKKQSLCFSQASLEFCLVQKGDMMCLRSGF